MKEISTLFGFETGNFHIHIISDEIGSKKPKSIMEFLRSEMLPPYLVPHARPPPKSPDNISKKQAVES